MSESDSEGHTTTSETNRNQSRQSRNMNNNMEAAINQAARQAATLALDDANDKFQVDKSTSGIISVPWDGDPSTYEKWMQVMKITMSNIKCSSAIEPDPNNPNQSIIGIPITQQQAEFDEIIEQDGTVRKPTEREKRIHKMNINALSLFTNSVPETMLTTIKLAQGADKIAYKVHLQLQKNYKDSTLTTSLPLAIQERDKVTDGMTTYEDADAFLNAFEDANNNVGEVNIAEKFSDNMMKTTIFSNVKDLAKAKSDWNAWVLTYATGNKLETETWTDFKNSLRQTHTLFKWPASTGTETAMIMRYKHKKKFMKPKKNQQISNAPYFPGNCNKCKTFGHKAIHCPRNGSRNNYPARRTPTPNGYNSSNNWNRGGPPRMRAARQQHQQHQGRRAPQGRYNNRSTNRPFRGRNNYRAPGQRNNRARQPRETLLMMEEVNDVDAVMAPQPKVDVYTDSNSEMDTSSEMADMIEHPEELLLHFWSHNVDFQCNTENIVNINDNNDKDTEEDKINAAKDQTMEPTAHEEQENNSTDKIIKEVDEFMDGITNEVEEALRGESDDSSNSNNESDNDDDSSSDDSIYTLEGPVNDQGMTLIDCCAVFMTTDFFRPQGPISTEYPILWSIPTTDFKLRFGFEEPSSMRLWRQNMMKNWISERIVDMYRQLMDPESINAAVIAARSKIYDRESDLYHVPKIPYVEAPCDQWYVGRYYKAVIEPQKRKQKQEDLSLLKADSDSDTDKDDSNSNNKDKGSNGDPNAESESKDNKNNSNGNNNNRGDSKDNDTNNNGSHNNNGDSNHNNCNNNEDCGNNNNDGDDEKSDKDSDSDDYPKQRPKSSPKRKKKRKKRNDIITSDSDTDDTSNMSIEEEEPEPVDPSTFGSNKWLVVKQKESPRSTMINSSLTMPQVKLEDLTPEEQRRLHVDTSVARHPDEDLNPETGKMWDCDPLKRSIPPSPDNKRPGRLQAENLKDETVIKGGDTDEGDNENYFAFMIEEQQEQKKPRFSNETDTEDTKVAAVENKQTEDSKPAAQLFESTTEDNADAESTTDMENDSEPEPNAMQTNEDANEQGPHSLVATMNLSPTVNAHLSTLFNNEDFDADNEDESFGDTDDASTSTDEEVVFARVLDTFLDPFYNEPRIRYSNHDEHLMEPNALQIRRRAMDAHEADPLRNMSYSDDDSSTDSSIKDDWEPAGTRTGFDGRLHQFETIRLCTAWEFDPYTPDVKCYTNQGTVRHYELRKYDEANPKPFIDENLRQVRNLYIYVNWGRWEIDILRRLAMEDNKSDEDYPIDDDQVMAVITFMNERHAVCSTPAIVGFIGELRLQNIAYTVEIYKDPTAEVHSLELSMSTYAKLRMRNYLHEYFGIVNDWALDDESIPADQPGYSPMPSEESDDSWDPELNNHTPTHGYYTPNNAIAEQYTLRNQIWHYLPEGQTDDLRRYQGGIVIDGPGADHTHIHHPPEHQNVYHGPEGTNLIEVAPGLQTTMPRRLAPPAPLPKMRAVRPRYIQEYDMDVVVIVFNMNEARKWIQDWDDTTPGEDRRLVAYYPPPGTSTVPRDFQTSFSRIERIKVWAPFPPKYSRYDADNYLAAPPEQTLSEQARSMALRGILYDIPRHAQFAEAQMNGDDMRLYDNEANNDDDDPPTETSVSYTVDSEAAIGDLSFNTLNLTDTSEETLFEVNEDTDPTPREIQQEQMRLRAIDVINQNGILINRNNVIPARPSWARNHNDMQTTYERNQKRPEILLDGPNEPEEREIYVGDQALPETIDVNMLECSNITKNDPTRRPIWIDSEGRIWIRCVCDSGASKSTVPSEKFLVKCLESNAVFKVAGGGQIPCKIKGDWLFSTVSGHKYRMTETHAMEGTTRAIISLGRLLKAGGVITYSGYDKIVVTITPNRDLTFYRNPADNLYCMNVCIGTQENAHMLGIETDNNDNNNNENEDENQRRWDAWNADSDEDYNPDDDSDNDNDDNNNNNNNNGNRQHKINYMTAHRVLAHPSHGPMMKMVKAFNWKLTGKQKVCDACRVSKAQQKPTNKESVDEDLEPAELLSLDASGPCQESRGGLQYWGLLLDIATKRLWSTFAKSKSDLCTPIEQIMRRLIARGFNIKRLRIDNGTEWTDIINGICNEFGITVELTSPDTPQFNPVERYFPTVRNKAYALMKDSELSDARAKLMWTFSVQDATLMENLIPRLGFANAFEPFDEIPTVRPEHLIRWGSRGWQTRRAKIKRKFTDKADIVYRVGYATNASSDTYLVLKRNNQVVRTRDVVWDEGRRYQNDDPSSDDDKSTTTDLPTPARLSNRASEESRDHHDVAPAGNPQQHAPAAGTSPYVHVIPNDEEETFQSRSSTTQPTPRRPPPSGPPPRPTRPRTPPGHRPLPPDPPPPRAPRRIRSVHTPPFSPTRQTRSISAARDRIQAPPARSTRSSQSSSGRMDAQTPLTAEPLSQCQVNALRQLDIESNPTTQLFPTIVEETEDEGLSDTDQGGQVEAAHILHELPSAMEVAYMIAETSDGEVDLGRAMEMLYVLGTEETWSDPKTDKEAMSGPNALQWKGGLFDEYDNFFKRKAWKIVDRPENTETQKTKNVYKRKTHPVTNEWRWRVRSVILGYRMVQGVHFEESFAATPMGESVRVVLALSLYMLAKLGKKNWIVADTLDCQQAFLNARLPNHIYIELPYMFKEYCASRGLIFTEDQVIEVANAQYGQPDAGRLWEQMFTGILTEKQGCEMVQCKSDPCVFYFRDPDVEPQDPSCLKAILLNYVDDSVLCGTPEMVKKIKDHIASKVKIVDIGRMKTHLSINYELKKDDMGYYFDCSMKDYIQDMIKFAEEMLGEKLKDFPTPTYGGTHLPENKGEKVNESGYRTLVGKALYACIKVLPDCANAVRDLCSHLSNPGEQHWKALKRLFGYLKHHPRNLKLREPKELRTIGWTDSDHGSDSNDRKSISSILTTIGGTSVVNWQSKKQQSVSLSSCESEIKAGALLAQDILFVNGLLEELLGTPAVYPSLMLSDNQGAIFVLKNNSIGPRTKHLDIKYRFIADLVKANKVRIQWVSTEENPADTNSKACKDALHLKHAEDIYNGQFRLCNREDVEEYRTRN